MTPPDIQPGHEDDDVKKFRGWRLLGVIGIVVVVLAIISAIVDWVVIGPLDGRIL